MWVIGLNPIWRTNKEKEMIYLVGTCFTSAYLRQPFTTFDYLVGCSVYYSKDGINEIRYFSSERSFRKSVKDNKNLRKLTIDSISLFNCDSKKGELTIMYPFLNPQNTIIYIKDLVKIDLNNDDKEECIIEQPSKKSIWQKIKRLFGRN